MLLGTEVVQVTGLDGTGKPAAVTEQATTSQIAACGSIGSYAFNANTATGNTTLTAANISGGSTEVTLNMSGTLTGAANAQLPTVAALVAALPNPQIGTTYELCIMNTSSGAFAWTVTTNTGWTLNGTMTIAQTTLRSFYVTLTSLTAATLQSLGQTAFTTL